MIAQVRADKPLVHHLTNSVTINDCANVTLAMGGSPMMPEYLEEQGDFAAIGSALVLNTGTLNEAQIAVMHEALRHYHRLQKPVILDPVALGVSSARDRLNFSLLEAEGVRILKGNASEIGNAIGLGSRGRGTDSLDVVDEGFLHRAQHYCAQTQRILAVTGPIDWVISQDKIARIQNGSAWARQITGAGCMCASLCGVFAGVAEDLFEAALYALASFGIASELGQSRSSGIGNFRAEVFNALAGLDDSRFAKLKRCTLL